MVRTKVFVGNLSFKTQEPDLAREFEVAGKVATANIISRGSRSLGYGFVEFESLEEANKAVELLNKKLVDNREINVEVARPRDESAPKEPRAPRPPRGPRAPRAPRTGNNAAGNGNGSPSGEGQQAQQGGEGGAPRRRPQRRPNRGRRPQAGGEGGAPAPREGSAPRPEGGAPRAPRERRPRAPRPEGAPRAPRIASPNTLFVANLPYAIDDNGLSEIFAGLNIKGAHVIRKRNDRSKGYGFVEFNNAEDQAKALAATDKKKVNDRELIVKIAETQQKDAAVAGTGSPKPTNNNAAGSGSPAPTPAAVGSPKTN